VAKKPSLGPDLTASAALLQGIFRGRDTFEVPTPHGHLLCPAPTKCVHAVFGQMVGHTGRNKTSTVAKSLRSSGLRAPHTGCLRASQKRGHLPLGMDLVAPKPIQSIPGTKMTFFSSL
jgi:hypothetical protein